SPDANAYSAGLTQAIAKLPQVRHVQSWVGVFAIPLTSAGAPDLMRAARLNIAGSLDGLYFDIDRATPVSGRMADADRDDEFVTTELGARLMGWRVGQVIPIGAYGPAQANQPGFGTPEVPPLRRVDMHLVGLVVFNNEVVEDDADRLPTNELFTPAFTRSFASSGGTQGTWYGLQLVHGDRDVA